MIIGVGHDICDVTRVEQVLSGSTGERFASRILTDGECELIRDSSSARKAEFIAGRFAAKEAVVKALGCGIGEAVSFKDIEIGRSSSGKPECRLSAAAWSRLGYEEQRIPALHVSITHERKLASAFVIAET